MNITRAMKIKIQILSGSRVQILVTNVANDVIALTTSINKLMSDEGQRLMDAVFGTFLADVIRSRQDYEAMTYEWDQKTGATTL